MSDRLDTPPFDSGDDWLPNPEETARLAHSYYEARGYSHGLHEDDWHRAEAELKNSARPAGAAVEGGAARTVVAVFPSLEDGRRACQDLQEEAFSKDEISLIANNAATQEGPDPARDTYPQPASETGTDAGIGAALGGVGGLLLGLAGLAVPGVGPILAAGPIIAALGGAGLGAAAGGLIGALTERGVPEDRAAYYAEGVRRGGCLVTVHAAGLRADRAAEILDRNGAVDIDDRVSDWRKRGWIGPGAEAQPLDAEELRREQEYQQVSQRQADQWRRASRIY